MQIFLPEDLNWPRVSEHAFKSQKVTRGLDSVAVARVDSFVSASCDLMVSLITIFFNFRLVIVSNC
jgi:hypothetical protein